MQRISVWVRCLLACSGIAGCVQALGIEEAHVDPTFVDDLAESSALASSAAEGLCLEFDKGRLSHLLEDGRLPPLPESP